MRPSGNGAEQLSVLILAGGQSRRMGQDKALLPWQGDTLLGRTCRLALTCCPTVLVVTPWPQRYRSQLPQAVCFITESHPPGTPPPGPLMGFLRGLPQVSTEWVLLLACDLPRLSEALLQQWASQLDQVSPQMLAWVPRTEQGWEPLCGFYRRGCLQSLQQFAAGGGRSFQRWLDQEAVQPLTLPHAAVLWNCNTPQDWATIGGQDFC
ncbi:putative molybdenum cofactor guanylyltransferase [Halomicronema hongdechloris C2206]|uniref:Probable molybdenum cofactor guanylyltransferase n=1 Tax=Halomicronema hongdechloris C2206 TaxID=1641165 RepID=A0A1Z3HPH5_9CYAN|nr:molybdenum cofactor guanylyltransferase [Halomicronema hongdechloris]ASC72162.1 putative molybdenum cofactor guanylyltransferase [Halomicronema hongdechloris C2206]